MELTHKKNSLGFLANGGEMTGLIKNYPWSQTSLGSLEQWPQSLCTTVGILLHTRFPTFLFWGKERVCFYNDAFRPSLGVEGKHPWALGKKGEEVWPEIWATIKPWIDQVQAGGEAIWLEDQLVGFYRNGRMEDIFWTFSYSPVFDETGTAAGVLVTCQETTQKVRYFNQLEASKKQLQDLIMKAPVGICIVKREHIEVDIINNLFLELVGRTRGEMEHQPYWEVLREAAGHYAPLLQQVFDSGIPYTGTEHKVLLVRNGKEEYVYISFVYEPVKNDSQIIDQVMIVAIDVTKQVLARMEIEKAQAKERLAIEASHLGVFEVDLLTQKVTASAPLTELFGGQPTLDRNAYLGAVHPDDEQLRMDAFALAYRSGQLHYEARIRRKDGNIRWMRVSGIVLYDENSKPIQLVGVAQDITEQKKFAAELSRQVHERTRQLELSKKEIERTALELEKYVQELKRSNKNLEEFTYAASHDLKEPLRKIHFFSNRLKENIVQQLSPEDKRYFEKLENASTRMVSLIDDLLVFAQVSLQGRTPQTVHVGEVVQQVLNDLEVEIASKHPTITIDELPILKGQPRQLQQAFTNIISNALKYHKEGIAPQIEITYKKLKGSETPLKLSSPEREQPFHAISITDHGIGFDPEDAERIFNVFTRLHGNAEYGGNGVGLSIVQRVMQNHQGYVTAESKPGEGARLTLFFPAL